MPKSSISRRTPSWRSARSMPIEVSGLAIAADSVISSSRSEPVQSMAVQCQHHVREQGLGAQLVGGDVDRHGHARQPRGAPGRQLAAGLVEYPGAQSDDQAAFLGDGDELVGRDVAPGRRCASATALPRR